MNRILVIRGGAIGDFILTLPAIRALRETYRSARLELIGYKHIAELARNDYADAVRSIEYGPLSGFFARGGELDEELSNYFGSFDLILTYLFDPDQIFEANLRRAGAKQILRGQAKIEDGLHATRQLATPLEEFGINIRDFTPRLSVESDAREFAKRFLSGLDRPITALHAGSGSLRKNWPLENWIELGNGLLEQDDARSLIVVSGEADEAARTRLQREWQMPNIRFATNLPLPQLAGVLSQCCFVGHDSGISHLGAAVGAACVLLFGPTDPAVWGPQGGNVQVVRAENGNLADLSADEVLRQLKFTIRKNA